jgi:hypothetical protein
MLGPDIKPDPSEIAARRRFSAPSTYLLGGVLIGVGIVTLFIPEERRKSPAAILAGVVIIVLARYVRYLMIPDAWLANRKRRPPN